MFTGRDRRTIRRQRDARKEQAGDEARTQVADGRLRRLVPRRFALALDDSEACGVVNALLSLLATGVVIALGLWLLGSILLRASGVVLAVGGLVSTATTGSPGTAAASILGVLAWLVGHWLFALRHHYFCSPLARRVFNHALVSLNPTRWWGVPNVPPERRR